MGSGTPGPGEITVKFGLTARGVLWGAVLLAGVVAFGPGCAKKKTVGLIKGEPTLVVVQVNDQPITLGEVDRAVKQLYRQGRRPGVDPTAPEDSLQAKAIEDLISQRLLYLEARKAGTVPTDQEAADFIKGFWQQRFPSEDSFVVALKSIGMTKEQFVLDWQMNTGINKFLQKAVQETVKVTPEQAQAYYDAHQEEFRRGEMAHARHIFLPVPEGATPEVSASIKAKLEAIAAKIKGGADFAQVAQTSSQDPNSAPKGGDLGFFPRGSRMPAPLDSVAFALAPGTVSGPVRTSFGWHLIKTDEIVPSGIVPFAEIKDRLIPGLTQKRVGAKVEAWVAELKQKAKIKRKV
jgi:parvulin-like peptidyl-prolyl isomerase